MKEIIVTKPDDCPFRQVDYAEDCIGDECNIKRSEGAGDSCSNPKEFPPDCPLFEDDYLIKRRSE